MKKSKPKLLFSNMRKTKDMIRTWIDVKIENRIRIKTMQIHKTALDLPLLAKDSRDEPCSGGAGSSRS
jgi:hypothetical protein